MPEKDREKEWQKTLAGIKNPKAREFFTKGKSMVEAGGGFAMKRDSPEFQAWEDYFRKIAWVPMSFRSVATNPNHEAEWTAPTQWPQWFDSSAA